MRLPEIRHNLRMITDVCKKDVDGLARDAKASDERKRYIEQEDILLRKRLDEEAQRTLDSSLIRLQYLIWLLILVILRLQQVHLVADELVVRSKELSSAEDASLEAFSPIFSKLVEQYPREFDLYHLDELVVAAITPLVRLPHIRHWEDSDHHFTVSTPSRPVESSGRSLCVYHNIPVMGPSSENKRRRREVRSARDRFL